MAPGLWIWEARGPGEGDSGRVLGPVTDTRVFSSLCQSIPFRRLYVAEVG